MFDEEAFNKWRAVYKLRCDLHRSDRSDLEKRISFLREYRHLDGMDAEIDKLAARVAELTERQNEEAGEIKRLDVMRLIFGDGKGLYGS